MQILSETLDEPALEVNETWWNTRDLDTVSFNPGEYVMTVETADATVESAFTIIETPSIELVGQPEAGDTEVIIDCFVSPEIGFEVHVRVGDESGTDLTDVPAVLTPGDEKTGLTIPLTRELEADESVTSILVPPVGYDPDQALASDTRTVESAGGGGIALPSPPDDDDTDDETDADEEGDSGDQNEPDEDEGDDDAPTSDDSTDNGSSDRDVADDRESDDGMPGFGIVNAIGTIGGLGYLINRRLKDADEAE